MKTKYRSGKCVHCLDSSDKINNDHVFPASWYPDSTPENLEKWIIPSCECCNSRYGKMEREMLHRLGLCLDPRHIAALGITDKVHRALNGKNGKNARDIRARKKEREKILGDIIDVNSESQKGVYPTLQPAPYNQGETKKGILVPKEYFEKLAEKIVRGVTYLELGKYIDSKYLIRFGALRPGETDPILNAVLKFGVTLHRGPGIVVQVARVPEDNLLSAWVIDFWQQFRMHALCLDKEAYKKRKPRNISEFAISSGSTKSP